MPRFACFNLVSAALCAVSMSVAQEGVAGEMMDAEDLLATIPGATLTGISNEDFRTRWTQIYDSGGSSGGSMGTFGERPYTSQWTVRRDLWCEDWGSGGGCWRLELVDAETIQPYHGDRKLPNAWRIVRPAEAK